MKRIKYLYVFLIITGITGCIKDNFDFDKLSTNLNWNPNIAAPAIHSRLTVRDIIRDYDTSHLFVEDSTKFLYLIYNKEVFTLPGNSYVKIEDQLFPLQSFNANEFTSQGFPSTNATVVVTKNLSLPLTLQQSTDVIDSLIFKEGNFTINVQSSFRHNGLLTITFPTIRKNSLPYSKTVQLDASGNFNYSNTFNDLADYHAVMPSANQLACELSLVLTKTWNNPVFPTDHATVNVGFNGLQYKIIFGYFGSRVIPVQEDTVKVDIFENTYSGHLYFVNPKIRIHWYNSIGVLIGVAYDNLRIYSQSDHTFYPYTLPSQYNPTIIQAPMYGENYKITTIQLDTTNFPPIRDIIYNNPYYFYLKTNATLNPPSTSQYNYITDTSRLAMNLEIELPLWGKSKQWIVQDTLPFNFSEYYKDSTVDLNNIEYVKFHFNMLNAMPSEVKVQVYFTDSLYHVIDSVFTPQNMMIITSGLVNSQGRVIQPTRKITDVVYTGTRLSGLLNVKYAFVRGYLTTTNNGNTIIKFYADNYLDVKVGVQVQAKINTQTDLGN